MLSYTANLFRPTAAWPWAWPDGRMDCWHQEIDKATTEEQVVRCASDYLALWAPRELEPLALGLIDKSIESVDDVERVKLWLTDNKSTAYSNPSHVAHLRELAGYFWHAASRVDEIRRSGQTMLDADALAQPLPLHNPLAPRRAGLDSPRA